MPASHLLFPDHPPGVSSAVIHYLLEVGKSLPILWVFASHPAFFSLPTKQPASSVDTKLCLLKKQEKMKKRVIWGIEVAEELQWKGWELGKEITKNLVLKNLSWKIQKIKYRYQYEGSETKPLSPQAPKEATL